MNFKKLMLFVALSMQVILNAQPAIEWQQFLGGSNFDLAMCGAKSNDGGFVMAGRTYSNDGDVSGNHGQFDMWVVKTNSEGTVIWKKTLGGLKDDNARTMKSTSDGGFIIGGETESIDGDAVGTSYGSDDYWLVKIDSSGNIEWQKRFGGFNADQLNSVAQTTDGGYIMAGTSDYGGGMVTTYLGGSDAWIVKVNSYGEYQWQKTLGGSQSDVATGILALSDGTYMVSGFTNSNDGNVTGAHGYNDGWIVKLTNNGNLIWQKTYGGSDQDIVNTIKPTADGGFVFAGRTSSNDGDVSGNHSWDGVSNFFAPDLWVVKIDSLGTIQWQKCFGSWGNEEAVAIEQTNDGGYIIAGNTDTPPNQEGDVTVGSDGGDDFWIVKIDAIGNLQWEQVHGGGSDDDPHEVLLAEDGGYVFVGYTGSTELGASQSNVSNFWILKYASEQLATSNFEKNSLSLYPNPAITTINISISSTNKVQKMAVFNSLGQMVSESKNENSVELGALTSGVYSLQVFDGQHLFTSKFIKK